MSREVWVRTRVLDEPWCDYIGCCPSCTVVWSSRNLAHCATCHRSFANDALFDRHQKVTREGTTCKKWVQGTFEKNGVLTQRG